jgi:Arc/MetJ-type ribon-helix-helix transcriptional regulator
MMKRILAPERAYTKVDELVNRRISITLPEETVRALDRLTDQGNRSRIIHRALRTYLARHDASDEVADPYLATRLYVEKTGRANLRRLLREQLESQSKLDPEFVDEWDRLADEVWLRGDD